MIRVLVVDDSAFMRKVISDLLNGETDITVIATAFNGKDAVEKAKKLKPDLITLDIEMPVMDGLKALQIIMKEIPTPVVMISGYSKVDAEATIKSLSLGAVDFVAKDKETAAGMANIKEEIINKCRTAARTNVKFLIKDRLINAGNIDGVRPKKIFSGSLGGGVGNKKIVAIGTSTGGPRALQEIITRLPGNFPCGIVIVQHMPPGFTKSLADRLNSLSELYVKEAEDNDLILPGTVLIAPGSKHMLIENSAKPLVKLNNNPPIGGHRPAVDPMMESVAKTFGAKSVGVILTGMGRDGANGIQAIKHQGGYTIAEAQSTSIVFGMPKAAIDLGVIDRVAPITDIASEISKAIGQ